MANSGGSLASRSRPSRQSCCPWCRARARSENRRANRTSWRLWAYWVARWTPRLAAVAAPPRSSASTWRWIPCKSCWRPCCHLLCVVLGPFRNILGRRKSQLAALFRSLVGVSKSRKKWLAFSLLDSDCSCSINWPIALSF